MFIGGLMLNLKFQYFGHVIFKKIGDIKGTSHVNMGTIKERNGKDLTEAEEIKKR